MPVIVVQRDIPIFTMVNAMPVPVGMVFILPVPGNVVKKDILIITMVLAIHVPVDIIRLQQVPGTVARMDIPIITMVNAITVPAGIILIQQVPVTVVLQGIPIIVTETVIPGLAAAAIHTTIGPHIPTALRIPIPIRIPTAIRRSEIKIKRAVTRKFDFFNPIIAVTVNVIVGILPFYRIFKSTFKSERTPFSRPNKKINGWKVDTAKYDRAKFT